MSLLAERGGGSLLTLPLCTGQTPGARRASPRGGQPDRRCEAPREARDAAEVRLLPARPKPLRGGRRVTQASAGPCPRPRPVSPRPPRTQVATMADSHTALTCAPRPRLTPATAPESVEVSGVILGLTGERGQGRPPPTVTATATATATSAPSARATLGPPPPVPGSPATPSIATPTTGASTGEALCSRDPRASPRRRRWSHRCTDGEARPPPECGTARGGPVGPRPAPPHTSRQHARL